MDKDVSISVINLYGLINHKTSNIQQSINRMNELDKKHKSNFDNILQTLSAFDKVHDSTIQSNILQ